MAESSAVQIQKGEIALGARGLELRNIEDLWRFAQYVVKAQMAPAGVETPEQALVAMQIGGELGFSPMRSLTVVHVIKGTPTLAANAMVALMLHSDLCIDGPRTDIVDEDKPTMRAVCRATRVGVGPVSTEFTVDDAKAAGLWGGRTRNGEPTNWSRFPKDMLIARAQSRMGRRYFPDVILGMYTPEEIQARETAAPNPFFRRAEVNVTPRAPEPVADPLLAETVPRLDVTAPPTAVEPTVGADDGATTETESSAPVASPRACEDCGRLPEFGHAAGCPKRGAL